MTWMRKPIADQLDGDPRGLADVLAVLGDLLDQGDELHIEPRPGTATESQSPVLAAGHAQNRRQPASGRICPPCGGNPADHPGREANRGLKLGDER